MTSGNWDLGIGKDWSIAKTLATQKYDLSSVPSTHLK